MQNQEVETAFGWFIKLLDITPCLIGMVFENTVMPILTFSAEV